MTNKEFIESISLEGEIWKDIIGYEDSYLISSYGRVISLEKLVFNRFKYIRRRPKLKVPQLNNDGYLKVQLIHNNKTKNHFIHRLVAIHFIPNPFNEPTIDHIDTVKTNNHVSNLKWCSIKENINNPLTMEILKNRNTSRGEKHYMSKSVICIFQNGNIKEYPNITATKEDLFCPSSVGRVCSGLYSQHKGCKFMYKSDYEALINMSKNESNPDTD